VSVALRLENPGKYVSYHIDPAVPNCFFFFKDRYETVLGHIRSLFDFYINLVAQHMKLSITFVFYLFFFCPCKSKSVAFIKVYICFS